MKRPLLLFLCLFLPGAILVIILTGEYDHETPDLTKKSTSTNPSHKKTSDEDEPPQVVQFADKITIVEPSVKDFVFKVHEEIVRPGGMAFLKTGELRGDKLDFTERGDLVHIAKPVLILYEKVDPLLLGDRPVADVTLVPIAEARADRAVLHQKENKAIMTGSVVIHHLENGNRSATLLTDSATCLLDQQLLTTEDVVRMEQILKPLDVNPDSSGEKGTLNLSGEGFSANITDGTFKILRTPTVTYQAADMLEPLVIRSQGPLTLTQPKEKSTDEENSGAVDAEKGAMVSKAEIVLDEEVVIDFPASFGGSTSGKTPRIEAGHMVLHLRNLGAKDPANKELVGQALRKIEASEGVKVSSEEVQSFSTNLLLVREDDGGFLLETSGSPRLVLTPGEKLDEDTKPKDPFDLGATTKGNIVLSCKDRIVITGKEEDVEGDEDVAAHRELVFRDVHLHKSAKILRITASTKKELKEDQQKDGLKGDEIFLALSRTETRDLWIKRVLSRGNARLFDAETLLFGDEIEALPPAPRPKSESSEEVPALSFGPLTVTGTSGLTTRVRGSFLPTAENNPKKDAKETEEGNSTLEVTCQDGIRYIPAPRAERKGLATSAKEHHVVFQGNVVALRTGEKEGSSPEELRANELWLDLSPSEESTQDQPRLEVHQVEAISQVTLSGQSSEAMGDRLLATVKPSSFNLVGSPSHLEQCDEAGTVTRSLKAQQVEYSSETEVFTATGQVDVFVLIDSASSSSSGILPIETGEETNKPSALRVLADEVVTHFVPAAETDPQGETPRVQLPERVKSLTATGNVQAFRWEDASRTGDPLRINGDSMNYQDELGEFVVQGTLEKPASIRRPNEAVAGEVDEVFGPTIRYKKGTDKTPDQILIPERGFARIYTASGESFFKIDEVDPKSETIIEGGPGAALSVEPRSQQDQRATNDKEKEKEVSLTEVGCKGPMTFIMGQHLRLEEDVQIRRFQPLGILQATTSCDLLTVYLDPETKEVAQDGQLIGKVSHVIALGSVRFAGDDKAGSGARLTWVPDENVMTLKGDEALARLKIRYKDGQVVTRQGRLFEYNFKTSHLRAIKPETKIRSGKRSDPKARTPGQE